MWLKKDILTKTDKADFKIAVLVVIVFSVFVYWLMFRNKGEAVVDFEKDLKESKEEKLNNNSLKDNSETLATVVTSNLQPLKIKAEDAYEVGVDSALVVSDIKNVEVLEYEKALNSENTENEVTDVLEVQNEEVSESKNTVIKTITEGLDDDINSLDSSKEILEISESENNIDVESMELKEDASKVIDEAKTTLSSVKEVEVDVVTEPEKVIVEEKETIKETIAEPLDNIQEKIISNDSFDCVIVVGAFKEAANKKAIIEKLTTLGYAHSEGVLTKGLNYVGVPVNCNDKQKKQKLLAELNEAFNISSWVKKI